MTTRKILLLAAGCLGIFGISCNTSESSTQTNTDSTAVTNQAGPKAPVTLTDAGATTEFPNAQLGIGQVTATPQGNDSVKVSFAFNVRNYDLKNQTSDEKSKICNNSAQGQHIHFILDNRPYVALYEPKHETVVAKNTEHYVLVFLSRSYHESIKHKGASALYHFKVDENGKLQKLGEPAKPMVFYSRPKGDYMGKDTENLLFDFYVWNTTLSQNGYKVKAQVKGDGQDTTMMVTEWKPYFLKNMPMGKSSIMLTLVDKDGNKVDGPQTEVTREINLSKDEPMKQ
jgi:hypothetical protein